MKLATAIYFNGSGSLYATACTLVGFLLGADGVNDPTITFYDGQAAVSGNEVIPTCTYDASALGLNGVMPGAMEIDCPNGIYVSVSGLGTGECVAYVWKGYHNKRV